MDGLAMVVAFIFANMLTTFDWAFEEVPGMTTWQGPVRWQIYGSGPRLQWQWAITIIIGVNIAVQLYDSFLILRHRHAKGLWLSLGGMLVAANAVDKRMAVVRPDQGAGFIPESKKAARFFIRQTKDTEGDEMRAVMISDKDEDQDRLNKYEVLDPRKPVTKKVQRTTTRSEARWTDYLRGHRHWIASIMLPIRGLQSLLIQWTTGCCSLPPLAPAARASRRQDS
ncbi:hypothetical protein IWX50DRAFT_613427 [Phyllosticta citricarpa]